MSPQVRRGSSTAHLILKLLVHVGVWHYDYAANRIRIDLRVTPTHLPGSLAHDGSASMMSVAGSIHTVNTTLVWFGEPGSSPHAGNFFVLVNPVPFVHICEKISYPGLSIVRPDHWCGCYRVPPLLR